MPKTKPDGGTAALRATFSRDLAEPAIAAARKVTDAKSQIPLLGYLLIEAAGDHVRFIATDLDRRIDVALFAEVAAKGSAIVEAKTLAAAMKKFPEGETVEARLDGDALKLTCGRNRLTLQTLAADEFPDLPIPAIDIAFAMPGEDFARALALCAPSVSDDETRYFLNGVMMGEDAQANLTFVATDGHRLARVYRDMPEGGGGLTPCIIPRAAVDDLIAIAGAHKANPVEIEVGAGKIRVRAGDTVYATKLIEASYPDYERIIPRDFSVTVVAETKALTAAVARAAVAASGESRMIVLRIREGGIDAIGTSAVAEAESNIDAAFDGAAFEIGLNSKYLLDHLQAAPAGGNVDLSFGTPAPGAPLTITAEALPGVTLVIMPIRVTAPSEGA